MNEQLNYLLEVCSLHRQSNAVFGSSQEQLKELLSTYYSGRACLRSTLDKLLLTLFGTLPNHEEVVNTLHDYCFLLDVNDRLLAVRLGAFIIQDKIPFRTFEEGLTELIDIIRECHTISDKYKNYLKLKWRINQLVAT